CWYRFIFFKKRIYTMLFHDFCYSTRTVASVPEKYEPEGFDPYFIGSCIAFQQLLIAEYLSPNPAKTLQPIYKFEDGTLCGIRKIPRQSHGEQQPPVGS